MHHLRALAPACFVESSERGPKPGAGPDDDRAPRRTIADPGRLGAAGSDGDLRHPRPAVEYDDGARAAQSRTRLAHGHRATQRYRADLWRNGRKPSVHGRATDPRSRGRHCAAALDPGNQPSRPPHRDSAHRRTRSHRRWQRRIGEGISGGRRVDAADRGAGCDGTGDEHRALPTHGDAPERRECPALGRPGCLWRRDFRSRDRDLPPRHHHSIGAARLRSAPSRGIVARGGRR